MPNAASAAVDEVIAFRVGEQEFCIDIMSVREIRGWTPATVLPEAPPWIRGVINLRGSVLPIVDLAQRLGFAGTQASQRHVIIVVQVGGRIVGLLVDAVSEILSHAADAVQPIPEAATETVKALVGGMLALEGRLIGRIKLEGVAPQSREAAW